MVDALVVSSCGVVDDFQRGFQLGVRAEHVGVARGLKHHVAPDGRWGPLFEALGTQVAEAPPQRPKPQTQDELLGLFSAEVTGRDFQMEPATIFDMVGKNEVLKPSLEVVYDNA